MWSYKQGLSGHLDPLWGAGGNSPGSSSDPAFTPWMHINPWLLRNPRRAGGQRQGVAHPRATWGILKSTLKDPNQESGCMYMYGWVPLLSTSKYHSIGNRLWSHNKIKCFLSFENRPSQNCAGTAPPACSSPSSASRWDTRRWLHKSDIPTGTVHLIQEHPVLLSPL